MRYLEAMKVPWALTVSLPSTLIRFSQSKIPSKRSGSAVLMVTKHSPAGGSVQTPGGASVGKARLELMPPVTVADAPESTDELADELAVVAGDGDEPIGEKTVGGGPRSPERRAQAPPSTIAATQAVIETLLRIVPLPPGADSNPLLHASRWSWGPC